jgi:hypothetical protein
MNEQNVNFINVIVPTVLWVNKNPQIIFMNTVKDR